MSDFLGNSWEESTYTLENAEVNSIWINPFPDTPDRGSSPLSSAPLHHFAFVFENATKNPDTPFNLWIDFLDLDDLSRFWVQSYYYDLAPRDKNGQSNLTLRDLNDIHTYSSNPILQGKNIEIPGLSACYARANYARLLVLEERVKTSDATHIIYADLDVPDPLTVPKDPKNIYQKTGVLLGTTSEAHIAHGYIALRKDGPHTKEFLEEAINSSEEWYKRHRGSNYMQVREALSNVFGEETTKKLAQKFLPPIGYKMPRDPFLSEHGIC